MIKLKMIDSGFVKALSNELNNELAGGRIDKIQQPAKDIVILIVRKDFENRRVLISSASGKARVHLTTQSYENPSEPPMFCMLLRKHISGGIINQVSQLNDDKIICIDISNYDDLGRSSSEKIVVEMIGRMPNMILIDDTDHIIDCIHRHDFRNPGLIYRLPDKPDNMITSNVQILSPSIYLDDYYTKKEIEDLYRSKSKELRTILNNNLKRSEKKLANRQMEYQKTDSRDEIRKKADLITANIYRIKKGDRILTCEDYYNNNQIISLELDPMKSPQEYSSKLYKEYNKLKTARSYLTGLIKEAEEQIDYLRSEIDLLSRAECDNDIEEIRSELINNGFIKQSGKKHNIKNSNNKRKYKSLTSKSGKQILIGRNNTENEEITFKIASRSDIWFHAKGYHGSHVVLILNGEEASDEDIQETANIASLYSEAKGDCYVDYCPVRNVKKQKGSLPGKVNFTDYKTIKARI